MSAPTDDERLMLDHLCANFRGGCDVAEIRRQARWYAETDESRYARLPELLDAALAEARTKKATQQAEEGAPA
ncbi:hypothetical protein GCM10007320_08860 [Pseudorhodoferax aquiterrae]|uniref:Uncharacterized protein n=1 Tax=Pseudorhodoferax aquiterrae TaxID=747304 RepID=A0ABQ3FX05_9BURK|nr:hypothetical protein [Pseudorhodoferax aquiterrae]GHC72764.1 hypothetical protein GCM10007320_08860 [Pseudorhodoferax aquiterrae]